ncbi:MAG: hypothetical protein ACJ8HU_07360 [Chthoniobacterales bacterium]
MSGLRNSSSRSRQLLVRPALLLLFASSAFATGYFGPSVYLDEGGRRVTGSPEFYWGLEVKRLSRDFQTPERLVPVPLKTDEEGAVDRGPFAEVTAEVDAKDFADALEHGAIKPPDPAHAKEQNESARAAIGDPSSATLPAEFESEFADYHRGAFAFSRGQEHWDEAKRAWETLLGRPPNERHYRSVWAAFMLGKVALKKLDPEAVTWFHRTRELAHDGFNDSLGMAADSYGWEARSQWKQGHPEQAAPLYLSQLALGDGSAVISLKALIPDREAIEGLLNYGPDPDEQQSWDDAAKRAQDEKELAGLKAAARDPLLRRLVTVHILATQTDPFLYEDMGRPAVRRSARWLAAIQETETGKVDDAEYLGWIAYGDGKYDQAARWLALSNGETPTPAALWLKSKLQLRAGKIAEATQTMARAWQTVRDPSAYSGAKRQENEASDENLYGEHWSFSQSASGDLGGLRLARSEFVASLDAFVRAKMWNDAAFIAERVLTTEELKKYVDAQPAEESEKIRYLLGRRLVREDRYADARPYVPEKYQQRLDEYVKALNAGGSPRSSKEERARAWFKAAWIARYDGMEMMGTEGAPDGFISEGSFPEPDLAKERLTGSYVKTSYDNNGEHQQRLPVALKPTASEKDRLTTNKIRPDTRFHYRVIAAALALRGAELLPDNSEELADVLNYAGRWSGERDQKLSERCYSMLEHRAAKTQIGRAAVAKHWFVDQDGPWSREETAAQPRETPSEQ